MIWRDHADLPEELIFNVNYLGGDMPTFALNFSRPAGQIVSQYYNFLRLGFEGYRKIQTACYHTAQYVADRDRQYGTVPTLFTTGVADFPPYAGRSRKAPVTVSASTISQTACAAADGRFPPIPSRPIGRTWSSSASSYATA